MTIFLLFGSLYSGHLISQKKVISGALLLGFIITVKVVPGLLVFYLLLRKQYKATVWVGLASLVFLLLPSLFVGFDKNLWLHQEWLSTISPFNKKYLLETKSGLFNLSAWVPALFSEMPSDSGLSLHRNLFSFSDNASHRITQILRLAFMLCTFYFFRKPSNGQARTGIDAYWPLSHVLFITPLVFPRQSKYAYVYVLPAVCYIVAYLLHQPKADLWKRNKYLLVGLGWVWATFTFTSINLVGRHWYNVFQDFKLITYGCFLLMGLLALVPPSKVGSRAIEENRYTAKVEENHVVRYP